MARQNPMTLLTPVKEEDLQRLTLLLRELRVSLDKGIPAPFEALGTIHYFRFVLLPPEEGSRVTRLVLCADFDGEDDELLTALTTDCTDFMDRYYACCAGYPVPDRRTDGSRKAFLLCCRVKPAAFFAGAPGRTVAQIRRESELRDHIWQFIRTGSWQGRTAADVMKAVQAEVRGRPAFAWAAEKSRLPGINILGLALIGIILLPLLPFIIIWIIILHFRFETTDKPLGLTPSQVDPVHTRRLEEYEDLHNQNQFTQLLVMKQGKMRLWTLLGFLRLAKALIASFFVHGKLMGIPTIHFARWQMIDGNRRMLFFSNFDGSWQQYLGDFIDKSGWGLTGIWSNTINFPKTRFLFTGGAYDAEHFLAWSRYYQIPTEVWYCAYPHLSIKNVMNNTWIRNNWHRDLNEHKAQQFLNRL